MLCKAINLDDVHQGKTADLHCLASNLMDVLGVPSGRTKYRSPIPLLATITLLAFRIESADIRFELLQRKFAPTTIQGLFRIKMASLASAVDQDATTNTTSTVRLPSTPCLSLHLCRLGHRPQLARQHAVSRSTSRFS